MANPYKAPDPMYGMAFARSKQGWAKSTPAASACRCFDVHCVKCGSYQVRLHAEFNEAAGQVLVLLICGHCRQQEQVRAQ